MLMTAKMSQIHYYKMLM